MSAKSESLLSRFGGEHRADGRRTSRRLNTRAVCSYDGQVRRGGQGTGRSPRCPSRPSNAMSSPEQNSILGSWSGWPRVSGASDSCATIRVRYDERVVSGSSSSGSGGSGACKLAGLERIRVEFIERPDEVDVLAEQIVENVVRADLQPVEQGQAYKRLMEMNGWTCQELAGTLGIEPTSVYRALALLRLPDDVAERVDAGEIKPTAAYELAKLQIADDQRAVAEKIIAGTLDHKGTVVEVRRRQASRSVRKGRARTKAKLPAEIRRRGPHGVRVTASTTGKHTLADVVADLRAVSDQLEQEMAAEDQAAT